MFYFESKYPLVRFTKASSSGGTGLRRGQLGALHAIASHFAIRDDPAVVTMPTGSGKTAVLNLSCYLLESRRVLVVTPSVLVRAQIASDFAGLSTLKGTGALPHDIEPPRVIEVKKRLATVQQWSDLAGFHVVVGTPNCVSPMLAGVAQPPGDLFDLVLVDEAHHSPAPTWNEILGAFPTARRLLVTATPFRRDKKEIKGRFIYEYPVRKAFDDRVFGEIEYVSVSDEGDPTANDIAIAKSTQRTFEADRSAGLNHFVMVRTDSLTRAEQLEAIYTAETSLQLRLIHSRRSLKYVEKAVQDLREKLIDGLICVDMLGEGFDFPHLKIAAVHAPHKSLAATLQFIGRFARTNAPDIGKAKFLAVPTDIEIQARKLYEEGTEWQQIVPLLYEERVMHEINVRESLQSFETVENSDDESEDLSLYGITPYCHVKIYRVDGNVELSRDFVPPVGLQVTHRKLSLEESAVVFVTKELTKPKWTSAGRFEKVVYDIFVIHHDAHTGLLFISTSRKLRPTQYQDLADQFCETAAQRLYLSEVERAFSGVGNLELFSVGMRNRWIGSNVETYRMMHGRSAGKAIRPSDARRFHRGHGFGKGEENGDAVTVGVSSSSKIWSNQYLQIPDLLSWCRRQARKLTTNNPLRTNCGWEVLPGTSVINKLPELPILSAEWDKETYLYPPRLRYESSGGEVATAQLLDCDLIPVAGEVSETERTLILKSPSFEFMVQFHVDRSPSFSIDAGGGTTQMLRGAEVVDVAEYFENAPPLFYFADFSMVQGRELFAPAPQVSFLSEQQIEKIGWASLNVDMTLESGVSSDGRLSIHDFIEARLNESGARVVLYDDGPGEIADFVSIDEDEKELRITMFHAKASEEATAGHRVGDVYEVVGQATKGLIWTHDVPRLLRRMGDRVTRVARSRFVRGSATELAELKLASQQKQVIYAMVLVQPGLSMTSLPEKLGALLGAANDFIVGSGACDRLRVWASA